MAEEPLPEDPVLSYTTLRGLSTLTGASTSDLDLFLLKELVDNALDAVESASARTPLSQVVSIDIRISNLVTVSVADSGPGFSKSDLKRIFNLRRGASTKRYWRRPTRGALGNALKCILGIPYALSSDMGVEPPEWPVMIESRGTRYRVGLRDGLTEVVMEETDRGEETGLTRVSVTIPRCNPSRRWEDYGKLILGYVILNPDSTVCVKIGEEGREVVRLAFEAVKDVRRFRGLSSVYWYSLDDFKELVMAYKRYAEETGREITLASFISKFRGVSKANRKKILAEVDMEYVSEVASSPETVSRLYKLLKRHSRKPTPRILHPLGREGLKVGIERVFGPLRFFKYKAIWSEVYERGRYVPFVVEGAIAVPEDPEMNRFVVQGINWSPSLGAPFDGYHITWSRRGKEVSEDILTPMLAKYGIREDEPAVAVLHLVCPNVEYHSYGKGRICIDPFVDAIGEVLLTICRSFRASRRKLGFGKGSVMRRMLRRELRRRLRLLEEYGHVPQEELTTQNGLWYKLRHELGGFVDISRKAFFKALREECDALGVTREELGIVAASRAEMYFRGKTFPISLENLSYLAEKGCDVILIEKEGITKILAPYADRRGIALVHSRGFVVDYAKWLMELSEERGANIFLLTDFDASGLLIAQEVPTIPRIGVDPEMVEELGLSREEVEEAYDTKDGKAPKQHLKALPPELAKEVKEKRIEIDAVIATAGPERFWSIVEKRVAELAPKRDLRRSVELADRDLIPQEILQPLTRIEERVAQLARQKYEPIEEELKEWKGLADIEEVEDDVRLRVTRALREDSLIKSLASELARLVEKLGGSRDA